MYLCMPDGIFSNQKFQFGLILKCLAMRDVGKLYLPMSSWSILLPFRVFYDHLVYLSRFWYVVPRKIWQSWYTVVYDEE
jgi:hypothetical protein